MKVITSFSIVIGDINTVLNNSLQSKKGSESKHRRQGSKTKTNASAVEETSGPAHGKFTCDCTICIEQTKPDYNLDIYQNKLDVREQYYEGQEKKFSWLIDHLLPCNDKIRGCELLFPDSVLFMNGKPRVIVRNDKEHCLMPIRQLRKLNLQSIYKDFSNVVRERKKDLGGHFSKLF